MNWGLWDTIWGNIPEEEHKTFSPIQILKTGDLIGSNEEVSDRLMVKSTDVPTLTDFAQKAKLKGEQVVLFRFATTDYYATPLVIHKYDYSATTYYDEAYMARQSVFMDFDVIQLTFQKDGVYTVIPAVSSPIDIVNDVTPPLSITDNWWIWVIVIIGLIMLILIAPLLVPIVKLTCEVVALPFKGIAALFKRAGNKENKADKSSASEGSSGGSGKKKKISQTEYDNAKERFNKRE